MTAVDDALVFSAGESLHRLDPRTGHIDWRVHVAHLSGEVAGAGRWLVAPTLAGPVALDAGSGEIRWRADVGGAVGGVQVGAGAVAVDVWSDAGPPRLTVLDLATGEVMWRKPEGTSPFGGPIVLAGSTLFAQPTGSRVTAIDLGRGSERWSVATDGYPVAATADAVLIVRPTRPTTRGGPEQELVALGTRDGTEMWAQQIQQAGPITVSGDRVHVPEPGRILALDADDGAVMWSVEVEMSVADVTASDDLVVAAGPDGAVALDATSGQVRWETDRSSRWGVTSVRGVVMLVDDSGLLALDATTGRERFHVDQHAPVGCPVPVGDLIVTPTVRGVRAASSDDGDTRWREEILQLPEDRYAGQLHIAPWPVGDGDLVVGTAGWVGHPDPDLPLAVIEAATGRVRWQRDLGGPLIGPPTFSDDTVYVQTHSIEDGSATLAALDPVDGSERWERRTAVWWGWLGQASPGPQAALGHVLNVDGSAGVVAHDARSGEVVWRYRLDSDQPTRTLRTTADGTTAHVATGDELHALAVATGEQRWRLRFDDLLRGAPATSGDALVVGVGQQLIALDAATGARRWEVAVDGGVGAGVTVEGDRVYVASGNGLAIHDLASGRELAARETDRAVIAPPIVADGRLVACLGDGSLAAW